MRNVIILSLTAVFSSGAWAWSAMYLGGQNWAIICANGTSHSYSGSSAGLDTVGPALCPGGIADPGDPMPGPVWTVEKVQKEILSKPGPRPTPGKAIDKASPELAR